MIPRTFAYQVPGVLLIRKPQVLTKLVAGDAEFRQLGHQSLKRRAFLKPIEKRHELVKSFRHRSLSSQPRATTANTHSMPS
jgi:hypothetical protein